MTSNVRQPAVAGRFYPGDPAELRHDVESYLSPPEQPVHAIGCIAPHAGYIYSGSVAGEVFARVEIPACCILMCPNHTGVGEPLAIMSRGAWQTPLGAVPIDTELAEALKQSCQLLTEDAAAHRAEHAAEVELPFLQMRRPGIRFVPIALGTGRFEVLHRLGEAIAEVVSARAAPVLLIASSDMNHYEDDATTRVKDHKAIDRILALDPEGLFHVVIREHVSMCGFGPVISMLSAAKRLGATTAELVRYATSGDVSGDRDMVVGYAGIVVQ
ncbi:MAG TPA: AmmeMemoRadiSam system protein B [Terriglobales bacterium]|jgi:hypothetical protein